MLAGRCCYACTIIAVSIKAGPGCIHLVGAAVEFVYCTISCIFMIPKVQSGLLLTEILLQEEKLQQWYIKFIQRALWLIKIPVGLPIL